MKIETKGLKLRGKKMKNKNGNQVILSIRIIFSKLEIRNTTKVPEMNRNKNRIDE
mgnify:CR=1 FL=1